MTKTDQRRVKGILIPILAAATVVGDSVIKPNILFMLSDDHAVQSIGCFGSIFHKYDPTPNLDRLASEGVAFANAFVQNSICSPSRAAILTGKYSHLNGVRAWETFDGSQQTMPKLLQSAGYHTVLIGKWHLTSDPTGFDEWTILPGQGEYFSPKFLSAKHGRDHPIVREGYVSEIITRMAENAIRKRAKDKPLALFVHHKSVHIPFLCDPRDREWIEEMTLPEPANLRDDWQGRPAMETAWNKVPNIRALHESFDEKGIKQRGRKRTADPAEAGLSIQERNVHRYQYYLKSYLRTARSIDRSMGQLIQVLADEGLTGSTAVVYMSDQGFYLGEHGMSDKRWAYEESMRTPLIVRHPDGVRGRKEDAFAMNVDLAPTLLEWAGVSVPGDMQGRSLAPLVAGTTPGNWRDHVYYRYYDSKGYNIPQHQAVRTATHKLIYFPATKRYELFDLVADPDEMKNLAGAPDQAGLLRAMQTKLTEAKRLAADKDPDDIEVRR